MQLRTTIKIKFPIYLVKQIIVNILLLGLLAVFVNPLYATNRSKIIKVLQDDSILVNIQKGNLKEIQRYIEKKGPNALILDSSATLLSYAIQQNSFKAVKFLVLNGADVNKPVKNYFPIMICAVNDYTSIAKYLIGKGARVDAQNNVNNTALILASRYGNLKMVKLLTKKGANPFIKNQTRQTALDYSNSFNQKKVSAHLKKEMQKYANSNLTATYDGPYVVNKNDKKVEIQFIIHKDKKSKTQLYRETIKWNADEVNFKNPVVSNSNFKISKFNFPEKDTAFFKNIDNIFVVGDVHGEYLSLVKLLKSNNIINGDLSWNFNKGHLVFMGDIFDRGENVTEILWLIYKLEKEAYVAGGRVHYLLGNHELMILQNDIRYVNDKYMYLAASTKIKYSDLFGKETILGGWLRTKKVAIVIDSILFVHAGISKELIDMKLSIKEMNRIICNVINEQPAKDKEEINKIDLITGENGPLWYRGYFGENIIIPKTTNEEISSILSYFNVNKIIVGHTEVNKIEPIYEGKIIPVDVPFNRQGIEAQGLKIFQKKFYRCYDDGRVEAI